MDAEDVAYVEKKGILAIREHAKRFLRERLFSFNRARDGRQTPYRGHPVFKAQHATGICCRKCLQKWHGIDKLANLTEDDIEGLSGILVSWVSDTDNLEKSGLNGSL